MEYSEHARIIFVTRKWPPSVGGMETYAKKISQELQKHTEVRVYALSTKNHRSVPGIGTLILFGVLTSFRLIFRSKRFDHIMIGDLATWPLALAALMRSPRMNVVIAAHGTDVSYAFRSTVKGRLYKLYLLFAVRALRKALIIANSKATESRVKEVGFQRTKVIPLAADGSNFAPSGQHSNNILFVGRIIPLKGLSWFVKEVLPGLPENIRLDVAGQILDPAEAKVLTHPRVHYLKTLNGNDLKPAYAKAMAVVVPNISMSTNEYEGFGLLATEAAASRGIVLAANLDGLKDAVMNNQTGYLLTAEKPEIWIDKISEISSWTISQRLDFIQSSMEYCRQWYSWSRVGQQTFNAFFTR
jgi:glycosyltransferase involved in cell wall biosynthesis